MTPSTQTPLCRLRSGMAEREEPRIAPGGRREIGPVNVAIVWALGRATGGRPPNIFTTLVVAMADEIHAAHGSMDVVINVAGISIWGAIERLGHEHWQRAIDIDLVGPISVLECFVPPVIRTLNRRLAAVAG